MRGRIAAACAAVLVGLASPGAFACASLAAASCAAVSEARYAHALACAVPAAGAARLEVHRAQHQRGSVASALRPAVAERRQIWRTPSGPAPSQAPPRG